MNLQPAGDSWHRRATRDRPSTTALFGSVTCARATAGPAERAVEATVYPMCRPWLRLHSGFCSKAGNVLRKRQNPQRASCSSNVHSLTQQLTVSETHELSADGDTHSAEAGLCH